MYVKVSHLEKLLVQVRKQLVVNGDGEIAIDVRKNEVVAVQGNGDWVDGEWCEGEEIAVVTK